MKQLSAEGIKTSNRNQCTLLNVMFSFVYLRVGTLCATGRFRIATRSFQPPLISALYSISDRRREAKNITFECALPKIDI